MPKHKVRGSGGPKDQETAPRSRRDKSPKVLGPPAEDEPAVARIEIAREAAHIHLALANAPAKDWRAPEALSALPTGGNDYRAVQLDGGISNDELHGPARTAEPVTHLPDEAECLFAQHFLFEMVFINLPLGLVGRYRLQREFHLVEVESDPVLPAGGKERRPYYPAGCRLFCYEIKTFEHPLEAINLELNHPPSPLKMWLAFHPYTMDGFEVCHVLVKIHSQPSFDSLLFEQGLPAGRQAAGRVENLHRVYREPLLDFASLRSKNNNTKKNWEFTPTLIP